ncbi:MAG: hypothetical protein ACI86H_001704, partial [bacterium]
MKLLRFQVKKMQMLRKMIISLISVFFLLMGSVNSGYAEQDRALKAKKSHKRRIALVIGNSS